jgi:adenylate kinase
MGVAGAGKSVQGRILAEKNGYRWLSSGELLRQYIDGEKRQDMLRGKLLDDDELIDIFSKTILNKGADKLILDGFPRTLVQAQWLLEQHKQGKVNIELVILLEVPKAIVKERLLDRGRLDDNDQAINKRFEEHEKMTIPIINLYKTHGIRIHEVDGNKPVEVVSQSIESSLKN